MADKKSVFHYYKEMIRLRSDSEYENTLAFGDFEAVETTEDEFFCYKRSDKDYEILVMVNLGSARIEVPDSLRGGEVILNNRDESGAVFIPYQAMVRARKK